MNNMNPRERMLLVVTVVSLALFIGWRMGLGDAFDGFFSGGASVKSAEKKFRTNLDALGEILTIEEQYFRIGQIPNQGEKKLSPALAFQEQVIQIAQKQGFQFPPARTVNSDIEGVDDYQLISTAIKTEGSFADTVELLKAYEAAGFLFLEMDLRSGIDSRVVTAAVTVARIAEKTGPRRGRDDGRLGRP